MDGWNLNRKLMNRWNYTESGIPTPLSAEELEKKREKQRQRQRQKRQRQKERVRKVIGTFEYLERSC